MVCSSSRKVLKLGALALMLCLMAAVVLLGAGDVYAADGSTGSLKYVGSERSGAQAEVSEDGEYVWYGSYPQTEIVGEESQSGAYGQKWKWDGCYEVDSALYETLQGLPEGSSGSGDGGPCWDANNDTTIDGMRYRRLQKSDAGYISSSGFKWADDIQWHYFRYDPIKWRILDMDGRHAFLLSDLNLDASVYASGETNWYWADVRTMLQNVFVFRAFPTSEERSHILREDHFGYTDNVFLLSEDDAKNTDYFPDKASRKAGNSAFAMARGTANAYGKWNWWLRVAQTYRPTEDYIMAKYVAYDGAIDTVEINKCYGVRPAIKLNLAGSNDLFDLTADDVTVTEATRVMNFDGSPQQAKVRIDGLAEGRDYELEYEHNIDPGTATVLIRGKGDWSGSITKNFQIKYQSSTSGQIVKDGRTYDSITLSQEQFPYDGEAVCPQVSVEGLDESDYRVTYADNDKVGLATVTVEGIGQASGSITQTFAIENRVDISGYRLNIRPQRMAYTGEPCEPQVSVRGIDWSADSTASASQAKPPYSVRYEDNVEIGQASVVVSGNEEAGYTGEIRGSFQIMEPVDISSLSPQLNQTMFKYDGQACEPKLEGLDEGLDYSIRYEDNTKVGTGRAIVTGMGAYKGSAELTFQIMQVAEPDAGQTFPAASIKLMYVVEGDAHGKVKLEYIDVNGDIRVRNCDGGGFVTCSDLAAGQACRVTLIPDYGYAHYPWMSYTEDYKVTNYDESQDSVELTPSAGQQLSIMSQEGQSRWFEEKSKFQYASYELSYDEPSAGQAVGNASSVLTSDGESKTYELTLDPEKLGNPGFMIAESSSEDAWRVLQEIFGDDKGTTRLMGPDDIYQNDKFYYVIVNPSESRDGYINTYSHNGSSQWNTENALRMVIYKPLGEVTLARDHYTYDGSAHRPGLTVRDTSGKILKEGLDYQIQGYQDDTAAGTGHVTVTGISPYVGNLDVPYTIEPRNVTVSGIRAQDKTYDGLSSARLDCSQVRFQLVGDDDEASTAGGDSATGEGAIAAGNAVVDGDELTVTAEGNFEDVNVGQNKAVQITSIALSGDSAGNYKLAADGQQTTAAADIIAWDVSEVAELIARDAEWTGSPVSTEVTVKVGSDTLVEGRDYSLTCSDNTEVSRDGHIAAVQVEFAGNYTGAARVNFHVTESDAWRIYYEARKARVSEVKTLIQALPELDDLTVADQARVETARQAYQSLPDNEKDDVGALAMSRLIYSELRMETLQQEADKANTPVKVAIKTPKAGKKKFTAKWSRASGLTGDSINVSYQVNYKLKGKSWKEKTTKNTYITIKSLKSRKYYYVRVRAINEVGDKTYIGSWSSTKKVKIK